MESDSDQEMKVNLEKNYRWLMYFQLNYNI